MSVQEVPPIKTLLQLSIPAIIVGVLSAVGLFAVDEAAHFIEGFLWMDLPGVWGIDPDSGWWIFGILSLTGIAIGLIVTYVPGHGGADSATVDLIAPPLKLVAVPGLVVVTVLALAGGVSLGPESPIIAVNTAILVALVARFWPRIGTELVVMMTASGTIGALFGTPVAAILVLTGVVASAQTGGLLWDRLFLPLLAASTGSMTMVFLDGPQLVARDVPPLTPPVLSFLPAAIVIACAAALIGLLGSVLFRPLHGLFRQLKRPLLYTTLGGLLLGLLGALGGPLTLFKGGPQMVELVSRAEEFTPWQLLFIIAIKLAALLIAATAGFRGGRIFPAVFIGAAVGILGHSIFQQIPLGPAIACGILGLVLAESRDGWIALFISIAVVSDISLLPLLCFAVLPVWLMVARAPKMMVYDPVNPKPTEPHG